MYCVTHQSTSNVYKNVQRNFSICEIQQKEFDHRNDLNVCRSIQFEKETKIFSFLGRNSSDIDRSLEYFSKTFRSFSQITQTE